MTFSLCLAAQENRDTFWFSPLAPSFGTIELGILADDNDEFVPLEAVTPFWLRHRHPHKRQQSNAFAPHIEQAVRILTAVQAAGNPASSPLVSSDDIIIIRPSPITDEPLPPATNPESPIQYGGVANWTFKPIEVRHHRPSPQYAARFLQQATFGARPGDIERVQEMGIKEWLRWQRDLAPSEHLPLMLQWQQPGSSPFQRQVDRADVWWHHALYGEDQLRQRMAFALSQILVVSRYHGTLGNSPNVMGQYYDLLSHHALGNYRDLLKAVTLSPAMGTYLSMMGNQKADPTKNRFPDENYAREVMQLFSIGLHQLHADGTPQRDANGNLIPTYRQTDIEALARVFTGWYVPGLCVASACDTNPDWFVPMQLDETRHDSDEKWILGEYFPAGQDAEQDLEQAIDLLFNHPNTPAFISHQLIQRLTHSNPSPRYVERVANRFRDNGKGVRGDLFAVVQAILLDKENVFKLTGEPRKVREPLVAMASLARALDMTVSGERMLDYFKSYSAYGQAPLAAPSVFNFFRPDYSQGNVEANGQVAPELEIITWNTFVEFNNRLWKVVRSHGNAPVGALFYASNDMASLLADPDAYLDWIDTYLFAYRMPMALRGTILDHLNAIPASQLNRRIQEPLYLAVSSPEFLLQE
ncbi:DUF1800 family protein [Ferrimonas balearica]|nr:DUF1800 domain-containing protein [Ferrimonas balearica]MBY5921236.1 DUF1800 domain-containing protein [Ferrimonas balearica]MBY5996079.1 DUF1800 domain-containing protein [Ferrimonas balearica]